MSVNKILLALGLVALLVAAPVVQAQDGKPACSTAYDRRQLRPPAASFKLLMAVLAYAVANTGVGESNDGNSDDVENDGGRSEADNDGMLHCCLDVHLCCLLQAVQKNSPADANCLCRERRG